MGNQCAKDLDKDISPKRIAPGSPLGSPPEAVAAPEEPGSLLREVFETMVVSDVLRPSIMLTFSTTDNPLEGFKRLVDRDVHSAPVKDLNTGEWIGCVLPCTLHIRSGECGRYLDVQDLAEYLVQLYAKMDRCNSRPILFDVIQVDWLHLGGAECVSTALNP